MDPARDRRRGGRQGNAPDKSPVPLVVAAPYWHGEWRWFESSFREDDFDWHFLNDRPKGFLERNCTSPNLAMIRTARQAIRLARDLPASTFFSHDPRMTFWCAFFAQRFGVDIPHIAYSFNFPVLPKGLKRRLMTTAFNDVEHFVVYSSMERHLYSAYFGIPADRISVCLWGWPHRRQRCPPSLRETTSPQSVATHATTPP
ncbi:MAG: hypothetical protein HN742_35940 [Lentisphaerae bacterium]|jgi:hypothetical protein|nr:hypothetical protein [Lentisphaerota bacterium]MBT5609787.1 hypothetical protein [Lentisphaerota bacterium]MBT7055072.1 hypothetical protein [Lentisphaerota bacterium]MBT7847317.1 hypothetical protein [Lentisphaerota bacterium]